MARAHSLMLATDGPLDEDLDFTPLIGVMFERKVRPFTIHACVSGWIPRSPDDSASEPYVYIRVITAGFGPDSDAET